MLGKAVQGLDLLSFGGTGLVTGLTVMVRPLPAAMTLARAVGRRMEDAAGRAAPTTRGTRRDRGPVRHDAVIGRAHGRVRTARPLGADPGKGSGTKDGQ